MLHSELKKEPADVVTVSCGHYAHCYVSSDILMTPWGNWAEGLIDQLNPKVVLPCHHTGADQVKHLKGFLDYTQKTSVLEYTRNTLPSTRQVIMLQESLESLM